MTARQASFLLGVVAGSFAAALLVFFGKLATQAEKYEDALGTDARERQEQLAKERHVCCGMPKHAGHHESCSLRPADEPQPGVEGQTSLL